MATPKRNMLRNSRSDSSEEEDGAVVLINFPPKLPNTGIANKFGPLFASSTSASVAITVDGFVSDENEDQDGEVPKERRVSSGSLNANLNTLDTDANPMYMFNNEDAEFLSLYADEVPIRNPNLPCCSEDEEDLLIEDSIDRFAIENDSKHDTQSYLAEEDLDEEVERWESARAIHGQGTGVYDASILENTHSSTASQLFDPTRTYDGHNAHQPLRLKANHRGSRSFASFSTSTIDVEENEHILSGICAFSTKTLSRLNDQLHSLNSRVLGIQKRIQELQKSF
ncbi:hypothetical protein MDAP_000776 [Mitosporidium daphniae]|uniref:Uncharacterized protein n=1 Tax=Mitosporidium daphniae TaxID=1485682 RepID=A0A098VV78_9MICR|nr:uncharacterized protein DI09_2p80 [Mitosporidium daphniae]KGG51631.1 hypothetical protein DI09_2p80 [Mitosporidium daphniae]|eukprot:XP_013238114.1 uncharacterized protein DI09_2p80 [Mitosporidium daphniae]